MKPPSSRAGPQSLTSRRAQPENARSYPVVPHPARRPLAHPDLFRPPPGIRALRPPRKRRRRDRARGGHSQRRGGDRVGARNLWGTRDLSRRQPRVLRRRVRSGAGGHGSGGARACGRAARLQRGRGRRRSFSRLHLVDRLLPCAAGGASHGDRIRAQAQSRLSIDPPRVPQLRAGGRDYALRPAPRVARRSARCALPGENRGHHALRAAPELDRARLCGPSRQPRVRSRSRGHDGERGAVDPRTHAHLLRLPRARHSGDLQPARLPGRAHRVRARPHRGDLSSQPRRQVPSEIDTGAQPSPTGSSARLQTIVFPSSDRLPSIGNSPAGVAQCRPPCSDSIALRIGTTPTSRPSSSLPRNTGRFGYSLRMQSGVRQVSTSTISIASLAERASYRLKLLRQLPDTSGPCGAPFSFPCLTSSARRTRSGEGSKAGAARAMLGWILAGAAAAGGGGGASGWPAETQGCGLKQREPQPRAERLPLNEARADWQADSDPKGPSLPLLPMPTFAQPEQYQSKEYVIAARPPAGSSKAHASRTKTEFGAERKLFEKQLTCCDGNRQGKNYDIKSDTQRKINQRKCPPPCRPRTLSIRRRKTRTRSIFSLEYVLNRADDVSRGDESPGSAVAAVVAVVTQDEVVAIGYPARQAFRGLSALLVERKRPRRRHDSRRFRLDEDCVLLVAESLQILDGGIRAILANVIADPPDLYILIVDLEPLFVVRNPVTRKTDHPPDIAQARIFRILEDDDVSSLHLG